MRTHGIWLAGIILAACTDEGSRDEQLSSADAAATHDGGRIDEGSSGSAIESVASYSSTVASEVASNTPSNIEPDASLFTNDEAETDASVTDTVVSSGATLSSSDAGAPSDVSSDAGVDLTSDGPRAVVIDPNNLILDASFEDGIGDWLPLGNASIQQSGDTAHSGTKSLLCQGRTQSWEGPSIELLEAVEPGREYVVSAWVRTADTPGQAFHILRKAVCLTDAGPATDDAIYWELASIYAYDTWTLVTSAPFVVPDCELQTFAITFEGPSPGKDFYLDDVSVVPAP